MKSSKRWLNYSNVVATLALFVALGGGAWALSKNSVGSREIEKGGVRSSEIENEAVKGKDVKGETLDAGDIADGTLGAAELADGSVASAEIDNNAVGATEIAGSAVGSGKIAGSAVGSGKIASSAVGSAKVADGSLTGGDVAADSLTGAQIDESSLGILPDASRLGGRELVYGFADSADADQDVIATLPALGAELRDDGTVDDDLEIVLANTGPAAKITFICPTSGPSVPNGGTGSGSATVNTMFCMAFSPDPADPNQSLVFCANDLHNGVIRCEVLRAP